MPGSSWVVFDTNVYVAALREGYGGASFGRLEEAVPRTFLVSVVSAELLVGARDEGGRRAVRELVHRFQRLERVLVPSAASWNDLADVLARIARQEAGLRSRIHRLWNDGLIAMSARQIGATVITQNVRDFELLRRYVRFELEPAPGAPGT
jgi:predicted nucleic acid-binding protein